MKTIKFITLLALVSCGGKNHTLQVKAPEEDLVSGSTSHHFNIRFEYIKDIEKYCYMQYPEVDFDMTDEHQVAERNKLVSDCTLENISLIDADLPSDEVVDCDKPFGQMTDAEKAICEEL